MPEEGQDAPLPDEMPARLRPLPERFYHRDTPAVARSLLGAYLVHDSEEGRTVGRIVETEAYLGANDPASHAFGGRTARNAVMFDEPGLAYIYFIYGMYYCLNVTTMPAGIGEAVLLRALEPVAGLGLMRERRGLRTASGRGAGIRRQEAPNLEQLCNGPARLVLAMGITPRLSGHNLRRPPLQLMEDPERTHPEVEVTSRIGISKAADLPLRFSIAGSRFVSGSRRIRNAPSEDRAPARVDSGDGEQPRSV